MKAELLEVVEAARVREAETLLPHVNDEEPDAQGRWRVKDTVAHLAAWRQVAVGEVDSVLTGAAAPPEISGDGDAQNAKLYADLRDVPAREILDRATRSWVELATRLASCSEAQLRGPRPGKPDQQLWLAASGNGYSHLAEHLEYWYTERGDDAAAEAAAIWARDLTAALPDDVARGNGEYNLACFYAKRGRVDDALQRLQRGLGLSPELREWALQDADLDPIRSNPDVRRLLHG